MDANKIQKKNARCKLEQNAACRLKLILEAMPHKRKTVRPPKSHLTNHSGRVDDDKGINVIEVLKFMLHPLRLFTM